MVGEFVVYSLLGSHFYAQVNLVAFAFVSRLCLDIMYDCRLLRWCLKGLC